MEIGKSVNPAAAMAAVSQKKGILFDIREGHSRTLPGECGERYHIPFSDIERFMLGTLSGEQAQKLVSTLIFLSAKWRSAYIVADSQSMGEKASQILEKLGFKDSVLVESGASGLRFSLSHLTASNDRRAMVAAGSKGICACI